MSDQLPTEEQLRLLAKQYDDVSRLLLEQGERIRLIEQHLSAKAPARPSSAPQIPPASPDVVAATPPAPQVRKSNSLDLENRIGGSWLNRVGIIAITLGVGFFLKYAFENQWVGARGRITAGVASGLAFLFAAERLRARGYRSYAHGLAGGGILILYLSTYAAYAYYGLIDHLSAFILMAAVTTLAVLLAARFDAVVIAALGLVGGFLTPVLLATGIDQQVQLFTYVTLLNIGVLALAYAKGWRSLNYAAFAATSLVMLAWYAEWYTREKLFSTLFFLTLFWVIFALIPIFNNILKQRPTLWPDVSLIFGNAAFYYGVCFMLLNDQYHALMSSLALALAACYLAIGEYARRRNLRDQLLFFTFIGVAITFVTVAIPVQLRQQWITVAWAVEAAVLTWIGFRARSRAARLWALPIFGVGILHWLGNDVLDAATLQSATFVPLFNARAFPGAAVIASLAFAGWLYHRDSAHNVEARERELLRGGLWLAANLIALTVLSIDAHDYFEVRNLELAKQLSLSIIWALYSGITLTLGILKGARLMRVAALGLLCITVVKVFLLDLSSLERFYRIISFVLLGAILLAVSFLYQQRQRHPDFKGET
ncbi:MAG: DUF2339 domain-containing protein [Pyrinomonadaceae bacterium]